MRCKGPLIRRKVLIKCLPLLFVFTFIWLKVRVSEDGLVGDNLIFNGSEDSSPSSPEPLPFSLEVLASLIEKSNHRQLIRNEDKFGHLGPTDPVLVVQVHSRDQYLIALIQSLKKVKDIEKSLIIFSHDLFDLQINAIIEQIDFCKVLQIFYPFSLQLYPNSFPGTDKRDCPRDLKRDEAIKKNCLNADYPDTYGHYREAKYTQTKHHWFWKVNYVLDGLRATRNHTGLYVLLEEDHLAAPDLLHMLHSMDALRKKQCADCDMLTLGIYAKSVNYARNGNRVEVHKWISSRHNMAMVLDRSSWAKVKACASAFCTYDDYNWDWSLQHISLKCLPNPLKTLVVAAPRVFHVGECGVHHKGKRCSDKSLIKKVEQSLASSSKYLFPMELIVQPPIKRTFKMPKVNGGWGDHRDHLLCLHHMNGTAKLKQPVAQAVNSNL